MYVEGGHCLDELKDYVQTSLSIRQKVEDPLSLKQKGEYIKNEENLEEFDLYEVVKEEILHHKTAVVRL